VKASDRRLSPDEWLEAERAFAGGPVAFDPCTEDDNPARALAYCTPKRNGLDANWRAVALATAKAYSEEHGVELRPVTRLNPPWSDRLVWDFAAAAYAAEDHCVVVWSGVDFTAPWWRNLLRFARLRCDLFKRPKCLDPKTGKRMDVGRSAAGWLIGGSPADFGAFRDGFASLGSIEAPGDPDWEPLSRVYVYGNEVGRAAE